MFPAARCVLPVHLRPHATAPFRRAPALTSVSVRARRGGRRHLPSWEDGSDDDDDRIDDSFFGDGARDDESEDDGEEPTGPAERQRRPASPAPEPAGQLRGSDVLRALQRSTCPLCRGVLFAPGLAAENNPVFDFDEGFEEGPLSEDCEDGFGLPAQKGSEGIQTPVAEKMVFPVRLGKFKNVGTHGAVEGGNANGAVLRREEGESSSSSLDARRCFSMGTYQYVLGASELRVALQPGLIRNGAGGAMRARPAGISSVNAEIMEGKKICARNKGESFSVSKIWQWSNLKGKLPGGSDDCSEAGSLPWMKKGGTGDTSNM